MSSVNVKSDDRPKITEVQYEAAKALYEDKGYYVDLMPGRTEFPVDGWFTIEQLEAIILAKRYVDQQVNQTEKESES